MDKRTPDTTRAARERRIARLERMAHVFDSSVRVPLIGSRVGLDGLVGLIPGIGDAAGGAMSAWMIAEAARGGARKRVLAKMTLNAAIDSVLGVIPVLGDLFDFAFKANGRNARLAVAELRRIAPTPQIKGEIHDRTGQALVADRR
jgi:hypothetical protein